MIEKVYLGLGSNLGDRKANLETTLEEISQIITVSKRSQIYETEPYGYKKQRDFLNMVIEIETSLSPTELIIKLHEIEHKMGRLREITNGPRKIDIDIIFYNDEIIESQNLKIPHPDMHKRKFVLKPLTDINEEFIHPILKKTMRELLKNLKSSEKIKLWT